MRDEVPADLRSPTRDDHRTNLREPTKDHEGDDAVAVNNTMDPVVWLRKHLEDGASDLLREMIRSFAEQLMDAEA